MAPVLGDLEQLVLMAVLRLGDEAYAVSVREEIATRAGRDVSRGAIQVTLDRMERKGYLKSRLGSPTAERGGKAKRLFTLTASGTRTLRAALEGTRAMLEGLPDDLIWGTRR
jgi:DNA-binding PadR family transcriptional regulator